MKIKVLFCWSCFGLFQLVSTYSLSQNTIESAETSRLFDQPNQPKHYWTALINLARWARITMTEVYEHLVQ
jgi:hypothetical protein